MRRVLRCLMMALAALILTISGVVLHTIYFKPLRLDWFYSKVFVSLVLDRPELISGLRILPSWADVFGDKLGDVSPEHERKMAKVVRDSLAELERYDRDALDVEGKRSFDTMHFFLQNQADGEPFMQNDFPVNQYAGIQTALPDFMVQMHRVTNNAEAENYIKRLSRFPIKFSQLIESLKQREAKGVIPPHFTVDKVLMQMQSFIDRPPQQHELYLSFKEKLDNIPATEMDAVTRTKLLRQSTSAIQDGVYPAYRNLIAYFKALQPKARAENGAWSLPSGDAYYAWCVRKHTTTNMTPQQVHEMGLEEVLRIGVEMDSVLRRQGLSKGTVGARLLQLAHQPAQMYADTPEGKKAILARYQAILDEINKGLGDTFDLRPKLGVKVEQVSPSSEATAPSAVYKIGAFDGSRPGIFYVNLRNPSEVTKFVMRTTAYHEGIPGHHFQMSVAQELTGVPFFRRILPISAYQEGWALYAERLAYELGFEKEPLDNLGRLSSEMMRAARLVVDSGIHYKRWSREQSIKYMIDNVGMTAEEAAAEVERYFVDPGQALAYEVGMVKILSLRKYAKQELGVKFYLKQFHKEILSHGALPLPVLERTINEWIEQSKKQK